MSHRSLAVSLVVIILQVGCEQGGTDLAPSPRETSLVSNSVGSGATVAVEAQPFQFQAPNLTPQEIRDGWISLFDGVSLFGWDVPQVTNWRVEDGCIVADSGEESLLTTPFNFDNFEFRCEFHLEPDGNSGVFLRTAADPQSPATDTYELNICDSHEAYPTGSLVARHKAVNIPAVEGDWHVFRVICDGFRIQVWLDERSIVDFNDESESPRSTGTIGLQMREGRIAFRNVFLRPIGTTELFNGKSLDGWSVVDGNQGEFGVVDGAIHVSNGPGFLQTNSVHSDFILNVEARTNGDALNSGIFFRAMSGTKESPSHGYEFQIHNGFEDDDRATPTDFGTGAVFRRVAARYVVADDHEWFYATLIAQGDRISTWVNGYQVVDWQDMREADENPRRGKRLEPGHISLQGHDPTTDLDFRVLRIHDFADE
ncbi:MAG: DUF1080 domain-containing protein [Fuerstiella sp.]|nr:DUF1080 domain-containing protein [Fuerstiella sp.]